MFWSGPVCFGADRYVLERTGMSSTEVYSSTQTRYPPHNVKVNVVILNQQYFPYIARNASYSGV